MQHHFSSYLSSSYPILSYQRHVTNSWSTHVLTNTTHVLHMLLQTQAQSNMWLGFRVFRIVYKAGQNMYCTLVLELTLLFPSLAKGNLSLWVRPNTHVLEYVMSIFNRMVTAPLWRQNDACQRQQRQGKLNRGPKHPQHLPILRAPEPVRYNDLTRPDST